MEYSHISPGSRPLCRFETAALRDGEFWLRLRVSVRALFRERASSL